MLSKEIFKQIIVDANKTTEDVEFEGNYLFAFYDDTFIVQKQSTDNAYNVNDVEIVPVSEILSTEVPFIEDNNRSDFTKVIEFAFPSDKTDVLEAMQDLRDYYFTNPRFTIVDNGITYNVNIKATRPNKTRELYDRSGKFIMVYQIKLDMSVYNSVKGYDSNDLTVKINNIDLDYIDFTFSSNMVLDPSNKFGSDITENEVYARGIGGVARMIHNKGTVTSLIFNTMIGVLPKETTFNLKYGLEAGFIEEFTIYFFDTTVTTSKNGVIIIDTKWSVN